jgi:glycosyltransferase involved in cell wall biosynthesis
MAAGLPVISFDCRVGPSTIVTNEIDGILVPPENVAALAEALDRLLSDAALRDRLGAAALAITGRYSLPAVAAQWEALIARR